MKRYVQEILEVAGISINGNNPWDIKVYNEDFYQKITDNSDLILGESYMENWWDCANLDEFFHKIMISNLDKVAAKHPKFWKYALKNALFRRLPTMINFQTQKRSLIVGEKHYDVGNDLYKAMLDKRMIYTCAYWKDAKTLDEAQEQKLRLTCEKLDLKPGMSVLDIGCGWGGLAKYMAENYGVTVKGVSISKEQIKMGQALCGDLPVTLILQDYRDLLNTSEKFDRVVSLGMFEHVGYKNYATYMDVAFHCLKDNGLFLLHTIGSNISNTITSHWLNAYIFPNGQLPSIAQIGTAIENKFVMEDWHNFGVHYDKTLMAWYHNFNQNWDSLKPHYDERFRRMWNYYLLSCAGGFRARKNQLWQILLSKKGLEKGFNRN